VQHAECSMVHAACILKCKISSAACCLQMLHEAVMRHHAECKRLIGAS
jgi:hypothetical protein